MLVGDVTGILRLVDQWTPTLTKAEQGMASFADKWSSIGQKMTGIGIGLMPSITAPLVAAGGAVLKLASDAEQSEGKFSDAFGAMSGAAEAWSKSMSDAFGTNEFEMRKMASSVELMVQDDGRRRGAGVRDVHLARRAGAQLRRTA